MAKHPRVPNSEVTNPKVSQSQISSMLFIKLIELPEEHLAARGCFALFSKGSQGIGILCDDFMESLFETRIPDESVTSLLTASIEFGNGHEGMGREK